jgi:hypothetical protein
LEGEFTLSMITERKAAGQWLAAFAGPEMDHGYITDPAYYAGGGFMYLPFAASEIGESRFITGTTGTQNQ